MKSNLPLILTVVGIVLVALSALWPMIFPPDRNWNEAKSQRMTELSNKAHGLLYEAVQAKENPKPGGPSRREAEQRYEEAKAELEALQQEFQGIQESPKTSAFYLRWAGIALVVAGGAALMIGGDA